MRAQRITIYGPEGIGKSTLASNAPNPLFIDTEMGTGHLPVDRVEVSTYNQFLAVVNSMLNEPHSYQTLVIDSADNLKRMCEDSICEENGWKSLETPGYGKGFRYAFERFKLMFALFDQLISRGVNVLNICHAKILRINPPDNAEYSKYCIKVSDSNKENDDSRMFLKEWSDCLLFCNYDMTIDSSQGKARRQERVVYTASAPAWEAKNRYGLPEKMPMTAESMSEIFACACGGDTVQAPAQTEAPQQPTTEVETDNTELLVRYFRGVGRLQAGEGLDKLPPKIHDALKARPEQALKAATDWLNKNGGASA